MSPRGSPTAVAVIFLLFSLLDYSLSDSIPDRPMFETSHPDPQGNQSQFQLVLGALEALDTKLNALQREIQEERAGRAENHREVATHLEALHTAVDPTSASLHYSKPENSSVLRKDLELLLKDPKATFFKGENLTGEAVNYDSSNTTYQGGCHQVNGIKSMPISESCVRVFGGKDCNDESYALYPKSKGSSIDIRTPVLSRVESIGPCLPNEFQYASVSLVGSRISVSKDESNVRQVPDWVDFDGLNMFYFDSTSISSDTNPVKNYYVEQGRLKWIYARIEKKHMKSNTESYSRMNMAIPPELGGPTSEAYNSFSQTRQNFEQWKQITDDVEVALKQSSTELVQVFVTFMYDDTPSAPDPYGFYYRISANNAKKIIYGFIEN